MGELDIEAVGLGGGKVRPFRRNASKNKGAEQPRARATDPRPEIVVRNELAAMTDQAEAALLAASDLGIYQRGGVLVHVGTVEASRKIRGVRREAAAPVIVPLRIPALVEKLDRAAKWVRFVKAKPDEMPDTKDGLKKVDARPDQDVARGLEARASWPLPYLAGVIQTPTLRPDGTILDRPGYDTETGLLYVPNATYPTIPAEPSREDAVRALEILREPLAEFPFVTEHHRAAALAAVLSCVARFAIAGAVPMFGIDARAPGTGKGLLVSALAMIGAGRAPARMTAPKDDGEEMRKAILALAMEGDPCILIDNVERPLGSDALASVVSDLVVKGRLLGVSKMVESECSAVWFATGNGLRFKGDLGRRVVPIDLDAGVENPEARTFNRPDLLAFVTSERPRFVSAALTILRAYHVAGRPPHERGAPIGSFEAWDALIRGVCAWIGLDDPTLGRERIRAEGDADLDGLRAFLAAAHEVQREVAWTVAALAKIATGTEYDELREALLNFGDGEKLSTRAIGKALDRYEGRIVDGRRFRRTTRGAGGSWKWRVEVVEA